jgi:hypothetical protein
MRQGRRKRIDVRVGRLDCSRVQVKVIDGGNFLGMGTFMDTREGNVEKERENMQS